MKKHPVFTMTLLFILSCIFFAQCRKINDTVIRDILIVKDISPTGGKPGTQVTVSGKGFSLILNEDTVLFNGKAAEIKKTTDTSIEVIAPQGGRTGKIKVMVRNKKAEGPAFTYLKEDQPQIISISPKTGWDYTINSVTITGKNFGNDKNKVTVTFDGKAASLQSFSATKLIVSPPQHTAGEASVVVKVNGKPSNTVKYTYQLEPVIISVYRKGWNPGDNTFYFVRVNNLVNESSKISLTINGHDAPIDSIFRSGTIEYNADPAGEKLITAFYVNNSIGYVSIMDFVVTSGGMKSDSFRYINEPRILDATSKTIGHIRNIYPGDTVTVSGMYLGKLNQSSKIEIWDSTVSTHYSPDPKILSWSDYKIQIVMPSGYPVPFGKRRLRMILKENGKETRAFFPFTVPCPALDEVYTGYYQYPNTAKQPYGIQLFPDGSMLFCSSYDDYTGTYSYDCNTEKITMDFGHGVIVSAIRDGQNLTHFYLIKSNGFNFVSGLLNITWNQKLDGTDWLLEPPQGNSTRMTFATGSMVKFDQAQATSTYNRKAGRIRFTIDGIKYFAIIEEGKMIGESSLGTWQGEKQ